MNRNDFRPGDRVVLAQDYTFRGEPEPATSLKPKAGARGVVQEQEVQVNSGDLSLIAILYDDKNGWWTDVACLEPGPPVSDEEMDEVLRSLGVRG